MDNNTIDNNTIDNNTIDTRTRITRTPEEMRDVILTFRVSKKEINELYRYARARKATMSYMIREALREKFPDIFTEINRHIRKPRKKPLETENPAQILHSLVDGNIKFIDTES